MQYREGGLAARHDPLTAGATVHRFKVLDFTPENIMGAATVAVTDATFDQEVRQSDIPVVVDFWAEWCGPCRQIGPALEELATEYKGRVKIVKVNVDENPDSPAELGVRGIPALFMFKNGQVVSNKVGAAPKAALATWIASAV